MHRCTCPLVGISMCLLSLSARSLRTRFSANFFSTGNIGAVGWLSSMSATEGEVGTKCAEQSLFRCTSSMEAVVSRLHFKQCTLVAFNTSMITSGGARMLSFCKCPDWQIGHTACSHLLASSCCVQQWAHARLPQPRSMGWSRIEWQMGHWRWASLSRSMYL